MNYIRRITHHIDMGFILSGCFLILIGLIALYSATYHITTPQFKGNFLRQIWWLLFGMGMIWLINSIEIRNFYYYAYIIYAFSLIGLILVLFIGHGAGAERWLTWGRINLQPSEFAKIGMLLALARFLADRNEKEINQAKTICISFLIIAIPAIIIMKQPDLSTALIFLMVFVPAIYWAGLSPFKIFILIAPIVSLIAAFNFYAFFCTMIFITGILFLSRRGIRTFIINFILNVSVGILTPFLWNQLHSYQQKRIFSFLGVELDPRGVDYQVIQSMVAIGSGGFWGKGFLKGTQTKLRFLPAQHTDFILSVWGEEFGLIGVMVVLALYFYLIYKALRIAEKSTDRFSSILTIGCAFILIFHIMINVGMTIGIMPVTGLPLPLLSYGGSFLVICLIFLGFMLNISRNQLKY
ncbi:rod shape-determining protein RodA [candidate division KSB1 bacterium]|nr:rod shape-determining protein RodA [candidate division KSB1 bacterium]